MIRPSASKAGLSAVLLAASVAGAARAEAPPPPDDDPPSPFSAPTPSAPAPAPSPKPPSAAAPAPSRPLPPPPPPARSPYPIPWPTAPSLPDSPPPPGFTVGSSPTGLTAVGPLATRRTRTQFGAYGEGLILAARDQDAVFDLRRLVASLAHAPTPWMRFLLAAELENARRFGMEQAYLELVPSPLLGMRAGLLLLPIGIINRWHDPLSFPMVERPLTDQLIIPTTWRELGAGIFGEIAEIFRYDVQVVGGLDAAGFSAQAPLWGGRGNGRSLGLDDAAVVGRLELGMPAHFAVGGGGYYGKASGGHAQLGRVTVALAEADVRFRGGGFDLRAQYTHLFILNSYLVNDYLGLLAQDAIAARGRGFYAQAAYDLLSLGDLDTKQQMLLYAAYENVNPRSRMSAYNFNYPTITPPGETPPNAPSPAKSFVRAGIVYRPHPVVALKVDIQVALNEESPPPAAPTVVPGAPGTPVPLPPELAQAARGLTRLGVALAFSF